MPAFQYHLFLVGRADLRDQVFGRIIRHDVIMLGDRMQDRHGDLVEPGRASAYRHRVVEQLVVPHQVLGNSAEILASQRQDVGCPAVEHPEGFDELVVPDVLP